MQTVIARRLRTFGLPGQRLVNGSAETQLLIDQHTYGIPAAHAPYASFIRLDAAMLAHIGHRKILRRIRHDRLMSGRHEPTAINR